jgi:hypothetical protein
MFSFPYNQSQQMESAFPVIKETVPQSALGYKANNKYTNFPPIMMDGRSITSTWQPEAMINADLIDRNNIKSNWQYRNFLTKNASDIMKYNFLESANDVGYYKRAIDIPSIQTNTYIPSQNSYTPYLYNSLTDNSRPTGYVSSNLKDLYLSREDLESRKISPAITQDQLLKHQSQGSQ